MKTAIVVALALCMAGFSEAAGADPPVLSITTFTRDAPGRFALHWTAETNAFTNVFFTVEGTASLDSNFITLSPPILENGSLAYTDSVLSAGGAAYYRVAEPAAFTPLNQPGAFAACAASNVNGLNTTGYGGAVFDGRYIYFVPFQRAGGYHGCVLRFDTQDDFTNATSWSAYDAGNVGGFATKGYEGGVFDGRYIYFSPAAGGASAGKVLRLDTQANFTNGASWSAFDASNVNGLPTYGFQGAVFDGRFVYFVGHFNTAFDGVMLRYDTRSDFTNAAGWQAFDAGSTGGLPTKGYSGGVFDGHYVYFVPTVNGVTPNGNGCVLRYDPQGPFTISSSWQAYDASTTAGLRATIFKGAAFDGRYVYFAPNVTATNVVLRYDTQGAFTNGSSWDAYNATITGGLLTQGYDGGVFDGRFVYFVPYHDTNSVFHARMLRYDTQGLFTNSAAWQAVDAGNTSGLQTQGYEGAVSDGRHIYFAPYRNILDASGNVLRFDSRLPRSIPSTVSGGSNL